MSNEPKPTEFLIGTALALYGGYRLGSKVIGKLASKLIKPPKKYTLNKYAVQRRMGGSFTSNSARPKNGRIPPPPSAPLNKFTAITRSRLIEMDRIVTEAIQLSPRD
jgi:hypothetical protein